MNLHKLKIRFPLYFWIFQIIIHIIRNLNKIIEISFLSIFQVIKITFPLDIITYSVFYFYFAPRIFRKENLFFNGFLIFLYLICYSLIWVLAYYLFFNVENNELKFVYFSSMGHTLLFSFYGLISRLAIDYFENREKQKELEKQHIKTELALLRSQIDPHFLFNTLNNINSFTSRNPAKASFAIIKLSEIMRYMLYEANDEKVLLSREIDYINNFLEIQKLRYKDTDFSTFEISGDYQNFKLPPMIFIPFIENAFKHGVKTNEKPIEIKLKIEKNKILFSVVNFKRELNETEKDKPKGIGIENIKRRLNLIFPETHELKIIDDETKFYVDLKIEL